MLEAMEEVAARDIMPTLRAKASSTSPRARQSCAHICCPRVEPMTLRVLMLLMLKGTEAMAKGHVVSFHVAGVVGVMQVAQTEVNLILKFRILTEYHGPERVQQRLYALECPHLHVAGVAPFRIVCHGVVA